MSFDDERVKPISRKLYLFELDWPLDTNTYFSDQSGIWQIPLSPNLGDGGVSITFDDGYIAYYEDSGRVTYLRIGSLTVDYEAYSQQTSITACILQNKSFFYDNVNYMLYMHLDGFTVPWGKIIQVGIILAFSNMSDSNNNIYYDGIPYDTRILSAPSLDKMKDNLFNGILQYTGGSVVLNNQDGYFETLISDINIFGQPVRLYAGFQELDFDDFRPIYKGYVDDYSYNRDSFTINIADAKKFLSRKIPINEFSISEYPNMKSDNSGKVKPLAWGSIRNAPLICLNELSTAPSTYQFYVTDTTYNPLLSISAIYVNSKELSTSEWSYSTTGLVYVSSDATIVDNGGSTMPVASNLGAVTADFVSASTKMLGQNVITDMLANYGNISTATLVNNYDSTAWATSLVDSREVAVYVNNEIEIKEIIEKICLAEDGIFLVMDDGRFTFRRDSTTYTLTRQIMSDEWLGDPEIEYRREEYLTSIKVRYDPNQSAGSFRSYLDNTYETVSYNKYRTYSQLEMDTILTSTTDVETKANIVMVHSKDIIPVITRKTKMQNVDLEIGDIILADHTRQSQDAVWKKYKVIGRNLNLDDNEIEFTQRWVSDSTS